MSALAFAGIFIALYGLFAFYNPQFFVGECNGVEFAVKGFDSACNIFAFDIQWVVDDGRGTNK